MLYAVVVLILIIAAILIFAATRPSTFEVRRSLDMKAAPERIYAILSDFHQWELWSPYEKLDPAMKRSFAGAPHGKGAIYAWEGNSKAGAGRMEIADTAAPSKVTIQLDFTRPFRANNQVNFTLQPDGGTTRVIWAMQGGSPFVAKVMGLFINMDKMIGKDFEQGLVNLKGLAEKEQPRLGM